MGRKIIAEASLYDQKPNAEKAYFRSLFWEGKGSFNNPFYRNLDDMLFNTLWL